MCDLYITAKDNKTYHTFQYECQKNISICRGVVQRYQGCCYDYAQQEGGDELAQQTPQAPMQGDTVHLPVALQEVDAECNDNAPCHRFECAEPEDAQQHAGYVEYA